MKIFKRFLMLFLFFVMLNFHLTAQAVPVFDIFPPYPGDDFIAQRGPSEEEQIFRDLRRGQLVVVRGTKILRLDLSDRAYVRILVNVTDQGEGKWEYQYQVSHTSDSKGSVKTWYLEIPRPDSPNPTGDNKSPMPFGINPDWKATHYSIGKGQWAVRWSRWDDQATVSRGKPESDFILESDLKPGFVKAYFQSHDPVGIPKQLTPDTQERLKVLNDLNYNSRSQLTLGPKFGKEFGDRDIAADFRVGISRMIIAKQLDETSPFVQSCLQYLREQIDNHDLDTTGADPRFNAVPNTPLEQSIYDALKIALDL